MSGNTLGTLCAVTNFGESHGPAIGCVIDGCPPGMPLAEADIQADLDRRRPGTSRHVTQRNEPDAVEILSGVYEGKTTGTPIALLIRNTDQRSKDYSNIAESFRPGHADYTYWHKYGIRDPRGGGRSSARLTAPTVAAGAVAKKWLAQQYGAQFRACMTQLGELPIPFESWDHVRSNPFFAPVADVQQYEDYMDALRKAGDSCGARSHRGRRHARRRTPAAARVAQAVLVPVGVVGMAGAKALGDVAVVLAALVGVADQQGNRRAGGLALVHAREDLDRVGLVALRDVAAGARAAPVQVSLDIGLGEGHAGRAAVNHAANGRAVGFTKVGDCE